jgi:hypothetical protein
VFLLAPGAAHPSWFKKIGSEFIVDRDTICLFINNELDMKITVDTENATVAIERMG